MTTNSPRPTPSSVRPKPKSVFVVSPIGVPGSDPHKKAAYALKYIFREALKGDEWEVHRADEGKSPDSIGQHVIKRLYEADLVIADLTGHNPNVFYELAIAHGWGKPVVHLIAEGEKVPFDIVDMRTIFYDITDLASVEDAVANLREYAEYAIQHAAELVTPLTSFEMFNQIRSDQTEGGGAVAEALEQVVARLARMESRMAGGAGSMKPYRKGYPLDASESAFDGIVGSFLDRYRLLSKQAFELMEMDGNPAADEVQMLHKEMETLQQTARSVMSSTQFKAFMDAVTDLPY
jgi:hypothetical protein